MEPHQEQQHYPSPARHHQQQHHGCHPIQSTSISDKRFIRRSVQGTPYPQAISIPPPFSSSPPRLTTGNFQSPSGAISIFSPRTPNGRARNSITPIPLPPPAGSPPQLVPRTPTSSLARRRRSIISTGSSSPSSSITTPPIPLFSPTSESPTKIMSQQHTFDAFGRDSMNSPRAISPGNNSNNLNGYNFGKRSLTSPPAPGLRNHNSFHREQENNKIGDDDDEDAYILEQELQEAMDEDERDDEMGQNQSMNGNGEPRWEGDSRARQHADATDSLAKIAQAMTLLSLKPPTDPLQPHFPNPYTSPSGGNIDPEPPWPPHPTPESLLRESLRQSLEALRLLKQLDNAVVLGSVARERQSNRKQSGSGSGRERDDHHRGLDAGINHDGVHVGHGDVSVVEVERAYERAAENIRSAREVLSWAEHWIGEEKNQTRERLLKG